MAISKTEPVNSNFTPEFLYLLSLLEERWDIAFGQMGYRRKLVGDARIAEKKRLVYRCAKLYTDFNNYITPTHWLHADAIGILLRDYYKV